MITMTHEEWVADGKRRFGNDSQAWKFQCPVCKHVASVKDWSDAGAPESAVAFSCVGRWTGGKDAFYGKKKKGPCNYAGGGLFRLNPIQVLHDGREHSVFAFAEGV